MKNILILGIFWGMVFGSAWGAANNWANNLLEEYVPPNWRNQREMPSFQAIMEIREHEQQR